ncbi:hypothetical protein BB561_005653 [Smittium simulii]|uniref:Mitochondrial carrier n=1 Tax=Smittium simulii TaxID=133385 RepID=A0A2T9Y977_9FUNG|nr:hypothetical protein BB561_005653 [Smittium simulii]
MSTVAPTISPASATQPRQSTAASTTIPMPLQEFIAGTAGGWAQVVVGHPFDTIKVRLQTMRSPTQYAGPLDCLRQTVRYEGAKALYSGVASPLVGIGFCNAVVFAANGAFRQLLADLKNTRVSDLSIIDKAQAGALAGFAMAFFNCPVELLKVKLQTQSKDTAASNRYTGVFDCGVKTVRQYGLTGLFRGLSATIMRDFPAFFAYFGSYEYLKHTFASLGRPATSNAPVPDASALHMFLAGGFAGIFAWAVSYPQDVIKSRIQFNQSPISVSAMVKLLSAEARASNQGYKVFFKGFTPTILRAFPANAATFLVYEFVSTRLKQF